MSWSFKGDSGWTAYSASDSASIEAAYARRAESPVFALNATYSVDFGRLVQFRNDDADRWRSVRRRPPHARTAQRPPPRAAAAAGAARRAAQGGSSDREKEDDDDESREQQEKEQKDDDEEEEEEESDDGEDEAYEEEGSEDDKWGAAARRRKKRARPAPAPAAKRKAAAAAAKAGERGAAEAGVPLPAAASAAAESAATRRLREVEEEKRAIIADYEKEIEAMHADMAEARGAYEAQLKTAEAELRSARAELAELRRDHDALVQSLSKATSIIGKRERPGAATEEAPTGKRTREAVEDAKDATQRMGKERRSEDDDPTQPLSQTLLVDDSAASSSQNRFSALNAAALFPQSSSSSSSAPPFRGVMERHLLNPSTLEHGQRPICSLVLSGLELVVGFSAGRVELWDVRRSVRTALIKEEPLPASLANTAAEHDDEWRGESANVHCLASYTARGGERVLLTGKGRRVVVYEAEADGRALRERRSVDLGRGCYVSALCVMREGWLCVGVTGAGFSIAVFDCDALLEAGPIAPLHRLAVVTNEVRRIVQLNDGRIAVAGCSSLQKPGDREESGAVELWSVGATHGTRSVLDGPTAPPDVGLRCNSLSLLNPASPGAVSDLVAAYEFCTSGERLALLHSIDAAQTKSSSAVVEARHLPPADENTYTSVTAYAGGSFLALTYGGALLHWRRVGRGTKAAWSASRTRAEEEAEMEDSTVIAFGDGRVVTTGGKGSVKLWR